MNEMIADDFNNYVKKAISFMNDKEFSKKYGINLRKKLYPTFIDNLAILLLIL